MQNDKKPKDQCIGPEILKARMSAFACKHIAKDYYNAYKSYKPKNGSWHAKSFLICMSIELAAKALHFDSNRTRKQVENMGHNIKRACGQTLLKSYNIVLDQSEKNELKKANEYYVTRAFNYFHFYSDSFTSPETAGAEAALEGYPNRPDLSKLEHIADKLLGAKIEGP